MMSELRGARAGGELQLDAPPLVRLGGVEAAARVQTRVRQIGSCVSVTKQEPDTMSSRPQMF